MLSYYLQLLSHFLEKYSVFRLYPSALSIDINKTNFLAVVKKNGDNFFLGSNGKLTSTNEINQDLPFIFGEFKIESFF